jgi:hypothetical protein
MLCVSKLDRNAKFIIPHPKERFFLSRTVQLLVLQSGESGFGDLVNRRHCIVLIPCAIYGSPELTIMEPESSDGTKQMITVRLEVDSIYMIPGRCSISLPEGSRHVFVMLCIRRGSI